jgi:hypothetical protein
MKALKIAMETVEVVEINGYDELKAQLDGGWLEGLRLSDDAFAYVDEEGIMKGLPYNAVATELCTRLKTGLQQGDFIKGTMIVVGTPDENGDETDCPDYLLALTGQDVETTLLLLKQKLGVEFKHSIGLCNDQQMPDNICGQ